MTDKRDFRWLLETAPKHPGKVYRGTDGYEYRWSAACGLQVRIIGGKGWVSMYIEVDTLSATFADEPEAESREAVAASAEGACWWFMGSDGIGQSHRWYHKKHGEWLDQFDTLTGEYSGRSRISESMDGWSPVLDSAGQPAEPLLGSQLWAQIVARELGKDVAYGRSYVRKARVHWNGTEFRFIDSEGCDRDKSTDIDGPYPDRWRIYEPEPAPSPILSSLQAAQAALTQAIAAAGGA